MAGSRAPIKWLAAALLAFFLLPLDRYLNRSNGRRDWGCARADSVFPQTLDSPQHWDSELTLSVKSFKPEISTAPGSNGSCDLPQSRDAVTIVRRQQAPPQVLRVCDPRAMWIAINIRECNLLRGDRLEIRGNVTRSPTVVITAENASLAERAWQKTAFWNHPFLFRGNSVKISYFPSLMTLMLPIPTRAAARPVVTIDSFVIATPLLLRLSSDINYDDTSAGDLEEEDEPPTSTLTTTLESIVGNASELREAVCYKKHAPEMYAKARAVARLLIQRRDLGMVTTIGSDFSGADSSSTSRGSALLTWGSRRRAGQYCTGWLVGRGNFLMTNYHCLADLSKTDPSGWGKIRTLSFGGCHDDPSGSSSSAASPSSGSRSSGGDPDAQVESTVVGFMAEAKRCQDPSSETLGVVEATNATVVATSSVLDYALLRIHPNDTGVDLARKYGYLELRAVGPKDGETIYIPQHPNGEAKEIAATKNGQPAIIRVPSPTSASSDSTSFASSSSSSAASSSSSSSTANHPLNPNVFYNADTRPGSSGSPVLSQRDHKVIALHHAGGAVPISAGDSRMNDFNAGVRIDLIVEDMRRKNAIPPCALARTCSAPSKDPCCKQKW